MFRLGLRSSWKGHSPISSLPLRVSLIPRASARRCTEISRFSRSITASGILAIFTPFAENLVKPFFLFFLLL